MAQLLKSHLIGEDVYESKKPQKMGKSKFFDDNSRPIKTKKAPSRFLTKQDLKSFLKDGD